MKHLSYSFYFLIVSNATKTSIQSALPAAMIVVGFLCLLSCLYFHRKTKNTSLVEQKTHLNLLFKSSLAIFMILLVLLFTLYILLSNNKPEPNSLPSSTTAPTTATVNEPTEAQATASPNESAASSTEKVAAPTDAPVLEEDDSDSQVTLMPTEEPIPSGTDGMNGELVTSEELFEN